MAPAYLEKIEHASAAVSTPYGETTIGWERDNDNVIVTTTIPSGADGYLFLPPELTIEELPHGVEAVLEGKASWLSPYQEGQNCWHLPAGFYQPVCTPAEVI